MLCTKTEQAFLAFTEGDVKFCYDTDVDVFCYLPFFLNMSYSVLLSSGFEKNIKSFKAL